MIMSVDECRRKHAALQNDIAACYTLWDRGSAIPVYVGTARSPSQIRRHLIKDHVREGKLGKLRINPPFHGFVLQQPIGWLGISFELYDDEASARAVERARIGEYGMRPIGSLFNRRSGG